MKDYAHHIENRIRRSIDEHVFPGCVVGIVERGGEQRILPFGKHTYDSVSRKVHKDTIYDVASITKAIPVSSLALRLVDAGRLGLEDRLVTYVPELRIPDREEVLIGHLLTHTLHFGFPLSAMKNESPETIMRAILDTPLKSKPGTHFSYANATSILLGLVIERIEEGPLDRVADRIFFSPLGMERTSFHPLSRFKREEIVPTEIDPRRGGQLLGEVHDESAWVLMHGQAGRSNGEGFGMRRDEVHPSVTAPETAHNRTPIPAIPGSAGLFTTAGDLLSFLRMIMNGGQHHGRQYLSTGIVREMHQNQIEGIGGCTGLGWELNQPRFMGSFDLGQRIGKTGFTGSVCICDMEKGIAMALLSNCTYPKRREDKEAINGVRRDIADIVFKC
jgi:CubicO group peptidase (beta-lactamase class C family)